MLKKTNISCFLQESRVHLAEYVLTRPLIRQKICMESSRILVAGFPDGTTRDQLIIYFQSERDSGGGDVRNIEIDGGQAVITFENVEGALVNRIHFNTVFSSEQIYCRSYTTAVPFTLSILLKAVSSQAVSVLVNKLADASLSF